MPYSPRQGGINDQGHVLAEVLRDFKTDVLRTFTIYEKQEGISSLRLIQRACGENTLWIVFLYRIGKWLKYDFRFPVLKTVLRIPVALLRRVIFFTHHTHIDLRANIGRGFFLAHYGGVWIGAVTIGTNCNISHEVTIGIGGKGEHRGLPRIGNNVYVGPGAKIYGDITVGDNVAIGANSVVSKSLPESAVAVGNPARVVGYDGSKGLLELTGRFRE